MVTSGLKVRGQGEMSVTALDAVWEPAGLVEPAPAVTTTVLSPDIRRCTRGAARTGLGG